MQQKLEGYVKPFVFGPEDMVWNRNFRIYSDFIKLQ